jgi:hypothetical protein
MKSTLDFRDGRLCVLNESELSGFDSAEPKERIREWYAVREAAETETTALIGREVKRADASEGLYVDEEGNDYQLAQRGNARPIAVMKVPLSEKATAPQLSDDGVPCSSEPSALNSAAAPVPHQRVKPKPLLRRRKGQAGGAAKAHRAAQSRTSEASAQTSTRTARAVSVERYRSADGGPAVAVEMNLRAKLAEVRRRIGYIQKRGLNERHKYRYVTAADIAGAVGDLLAELGVVIIPSLESISYIPSRNAAGQVDRIARVVMTYTFTNVDNGEAVTVKVPGEGLDDGDKATYKAMTGALKYALLQSFLLASGDDPEDDRYEVHHRGAANGAAHSDRKVNAKEIAELKHLIDETGTELERVLAYYKIKSLDEMTHLTYRRAVDLLNRKRTAQAGREANHHAQG